MLAQVSEPRKQREQTSESRLGGFVPMSLLDTQSRMPTRQKVLHSGSCKSKMQVSGLALPSALSLACRHCHPLCASVLIPSS